MNTYGITYWTGKQESVKALSLAEAYEKFYYPLFPRRANLWTDLTDDDGTALPYAIVTNEFGDECARIAIIAEGDNAESLSGQNDGERMRVLKYMVGVYMMYTLGHWTLEQTRTDLLRALKAAEKSRKKDWSQHCRALGLMVQDMDCGIILDAGNFDWFILQHCVTFLGFDA